MNSMSKTRRGYKKVKWLFGKEIEIPEEWEIKKINELGNIITGNTPPTSMQECYGEEILWASPTDLKDSKYVKNTNSKLSFKGIKQSRKIPTNSILVVCIGSTIGKIAIASKEMATNQQINSIICNSNNSEFIYYQLLRQNKKIKNFANQVAVPIINKSDFGTIKIMIPQKTNEQQKIASILSNVDALIESTQGMIEKTERLKKGLMQKLLTRGIGHTKFKKVKGMFGKYELIPEEWEIKKINELGNIVTGNTPSKSKQEYYGEDVLWASPTDLKDNKYVKNTNSKLSFKGSKQSRKIPKNSILFVCIGSIGKIAIASKDMTTNQQINSIICDSNDFEFVYYQLLKQNKKIKNFANHTVVPIINKSDFGAIKIIIPQKINEQTKIASILSGIDAYIQKNQEYKERLEILKKGLMQKLLTGKIRVKIQ